MKTSQLIAELVSAGCYLTKHGANHDHWYSPVTGRIFQVPRHGSHEIPRGTECKIRKQAGI